jgi:hypothetical protein
VGAWDAAGKAFDRLTGWIGRRRRRRVELLQAVVALSTFLQGSLPRLADAAGRWTPLHEDGQRWETLAREVISRGLEDPDESIAEAAEDLRSGVHLWARVYQFPGDILQMDRVFADHDVPLPRRVWAEGEAGTEPD